MYRYMFVCVYACVRVRVCVSRCSQLTNRSDHVMVFDQNLPEAVLSFGNNIITKSHPGQIGWHSKFASTFETVTRTRKYTTGKLLSFIMTIWIYEIMFYLKSFNLKSFNVSDYVEEVNWDAGLHYNAPDD